MADFHAIYSYASSGALLFERLPGVRISDMLTPRLPSLKKKPYSAITVQIDRLTSEQYDADDMSGIPDLIEVIRLQAEGPVEAARAIRKKLYAASHIHYAMMQLTYVQQVWKRTQATPRSHCS